MDLYLDKSKSPEVRARDLCARLTLREKVGQVHQQLYGFRAVQREGKELSFDKEFVNETDRFGGVGFLYGLYRADPWSARTFENGLRGADAVRAYNMVQQYTVTHSRFGIPIAVTAEYSHGHQALDGYMLPANLAVGCTFDPALFGRAAAVCARQVREMGIRLCYAAVLDVLRDPRWGRSEECFGEDPCLSSRLAEALTRGMMGQGVCVVAKHMCAQGETTGGKNSSPARIGERELREIHLPPVEAAVRAGAASMMAAYNEIDGVPCHANEWLLKDVLRGEYGFRGFVMADGCAIDRLEQLAGDVTRAGAMALEAGVDVGLWDVAFTKLAEAVEQGYVSEERLDEAVLRVLEFKFASGLFDDPYLPEEVELTEFTEDYAPESLMLARESVVLLKNEGGLLPLDAKKAQRVAVIGPQIDDLYRQMGDYSPPMEREKYVTLKDGLSEIKGAIQWCFDDGSDPERAAVLAAEADVALLALGGSSSRFERVVFDSNGEAVSHSVEMDCGEGVDCSSLRLPGGQKALFEAVRGSAKQLVMLLMAGRPYAIGEMAARSDALLVSFYPGPWGGRALAEIITGAQEPTGRLSVSFPHSAGELPCFYNAKRSDRVRTYVDAREHQHPLFMFGEGMGYEQAVYEDFSLENLLTECPVPDEHVLAARLCFTVRSIGTRPVTAVPMLMITDLEADITRRSLELKDFGRVPLMPGESRRVSLTLTARDLAVWNRRMKLEVQPGRVQLTLRDGFAQCWQGILLIP